MYGFVDQPINRLSHGSRFILWAMRAWIHAMGRKNCPPGVLAPAFAKMQVLPALPDLQIVMVFLNRDALEKRTFSPIECPHIAEDEAVMLALWRDIALGDVANAGITLAMLVEEQAIAPILQAMEALAAKLAEAHLSPAGLATSSEATFGHE